MNYDSKNTGGIGVYITFPDSVHLEPLGKSLGSYQGANIERLEMQAILEGMNAILALYRIQREKLQGVAHIIFLTDRLGLNDHDKTSPHNIRQWRHDRWHNFEGKAIKNSDLLEKIDKTRYKVISAAHCKVEISYSRRKANKEADGLSRAAKNQPPERTNVSLKGVKFGRRKFGGGAADYRLLHEGDEYVVHVYMKQPVKDQWAINTEICQRQFVGRKLTIYCDSEMEARLHRHHLYKVRIDRALRHHVTICRSLEEINAAEHPGSPFPS